MDGLKERDTWSLIEELIVRNIGHYMHRLDTSGEERVKYYTDFCKIEAEIKSRICPCRKSIMEPALTSTPEPSKPKFSKGDIVIWNSETPIPHYLTNPIVIIDTPIKITHMLRPEFSGWYYQVMFREADGYYKINNNLRIPESDLTPIEPSK